MLTVHCPHCGQLHNVRSSSIDTVRRCAACKRRFVLRAPGTPVGEIESPDSGEGLAYEPADYPTGGGANAGLQIAMLVALVLVVGVVLACCLLMGVAGRR